MALQIGQKVLVAGREQNGFAEVVSYPDARGTVEVAYYVNPTRVESQRVPLEALRAGELPSQTRCYYKDGGAFRIGRALACVPSPTGNSYHIAFPNNRVLLLPETEFHVRSYLGGAEPISTLSSLAHESPFLFERRSDWLKHYFRQVSLSRGMRGLLSSKVEFFPHQVEVIRRVLQDPIVRYLLADEVGLGKTIEAGIILRQLQLDAPRLRILAFVPPLLVGQWRDELSRRFSLVNVEVRPHDAIGSYDDEPPEIVVIDEAHRIITGELFKAACRATNPKRTPHLLLLSATPVLHHERELLALLHLLDPGTYDLDQLDQFRARLEMRRDLGRALLALSRSTRPAFILRHVRRCTELLPDDSIVTKTAGLCAEASGRDDEGDLLLQHAATLSIHLTETYRIHRRLLRTRRATLLEEGDFHQLRSEIPPIYEAHVRKGELLAELWLTLEEWRTRVAAHAAGHTSEQRRSLIGLYLQFAEAAAWDRKRLAMMLAERRRMVVPGEADTVERLMELTRRVEDTARIDGLLRFLEKSEASHWVAFCGTASRCAQTNKLVAGRWGGENFVVTSNTDVGESERRVSAFQSAKRAVLFGDRTVEEGLNLQFADGIVFVDLPFDPMRLEQRLGRLDRLDRRKPVRCITVLSLPEPTLAFDAAWYEVLTKGLGLFNGSLADLQFLVDREISRLADVAFEGGPAALLNQTSSLPSIIDTEREASAEQEILDGLYVSGLRDSPLWMSIEAADEEEDQFGEALRRYVKDNIGLAWRDVVLGHHSIVQLGLRRNAAPPLVPLALLPGIGRHAGKSVTVRRTLATRDLDVQLLRPGHPLVEELRALAEWDERGQAFALWRRAAGIVEPILVFRLGVRSLVNLDQFRERLDTLGWDEVARGSLLRLIEYWRPPDFHEVYVDSEGASAEARLVEICSSPYDGRIDIGLAGERSQVLIELTGEAVWREQCELVADRATEQIRNNPAFQAGMTKARREASEHFEMVTARLQARSRRHCEDTKPILRLIEEQCLLRQLVDSILSKPSLRIDSIGVYVISESEVCAR